MGTPRTLDIDVAFKAWPRPWQQDAASWLDRPAQGGFTREVVSHFLFLTLRLAGPFTLAERFVAFPDDGRSERAIRVQMKAGNVPVTLTGSIGTTPKDDHNLWTLQGSAGAIRLRDWSTAERLGADGIWQPVPNMLPHEKMRPLVLRRQLEGVAAMTRGAPHHLATLEEAFAVQEAVEAILGQVKARRSATFCEQKVAKKLCYFGPVPLQRLGPKIKEVFAPLFPKSGPFLSVIPLLLNEPTLGFPALGHGGTSMFKSINPATGQDIATYPELSPKEIAQKLDIATAGFQAWRHTSPAERAELLDRIADTFERNKERLAAMATAEMGKTLKSSLAEVEKCITGFRYYAKAGPEFWPPPVPASLTGPRKPTGCRKAPCSPSCRGISLTGRWCASRPDHHGRECRAVETCEPGPGCRKSFGGNGA